MPAGIFSMPSIGEQLGPSMQQLGSTLANIKNPNYDVQVALRQALAKDPELLQKLIDMGPEKITTIFGKNAAFLGQGDISPEEQIRRGVGDLMRTDPTAREEILASKSGSKTKTERTKDALDITGKQISNQMNTSQLNVQQATEDAQIKQVQDAQTLLRQKVTDMQTLVNRVPDIGAVDLNKVIMDAFRGRGDPATIARLNQAGVDISPMLTSLHQQAQIAAQFSLAKLREQSKEVKLMALSALEKRSDDTRNMIIQADNVIKDGQKTLTQDKLFTSKPRTDRNAAMWDAANARIQTYDAALQAKKQAEAEYNTYNPKRNELLDILINREAGTGGAGTVKTKTTDTEKVSINDVVPPELLGDVTKLNAANPLQRKAALLEIKKSNPMMYDKIVPYITK